MQGLEHASTDTLLPLSFHEWLGVGYLEGEVGKIDKEEKRHGRRAER